MAPKEQRKGFLGFLDRLIALLDGVKGIAMILAALSVGGASGTLMASDGDAAARVDSLAVVVDSLKVSQRQDRERQMEMFSAQVEADTALRAVLERRAMNKRKAAEERAGTEKMFNDILGGSP